MKDQPYDLPRIWIFSSTRNMQKEIIKRNTYILTTDVKNSISVTNTPSPIPQDMTAILTPKQHHNSSPQVSAEISPHPYTHPTSTPSAAYPTPP